MIIPARWYAGGKGLSEFRNKMDKKISQIHGFSKMQDCFSGIESEVEFVIFKG